MNSKARLAGRALAVVLSLAFGAPALAQKSVGDKAAAEALFDHAKRLLAAGRYAEACPKFAESQKLDAGIGTLLYLADCYEKNGQTASAWAGFREAAAAAKAAGQTDREKIARDRAAALEPSLSRLTITVEPANVLDGVEVTRNGAAVGKALWGTAIPVDPGPHKIEATAAGKKPWSGRVDVGTNAASASINVPKLVDQPAVPVTPHEPPPGDRTDAGSEQRAIGLVVAGVGVVGVAVGAAFGVQALSKDEEADTFCRKDDATLCSAEGVSLGDQAHTAALLSTIGFGAGAALIVGGAVLYFTAPSARRVGVGTAVSPAGGRLVLGGAF